MRKIRTIALAAAVFSLGACSFEVTNPGPIQNDLLDDPGQAEEHGRRARERVLDEHTYQHRAERLLELLGLRERAPIGG